MSESVHPAKQLKVMFLLAFMFESTVMRMCIYKKRVWSAPLHDEVVRVLYSKR